MRNIGTYKKNIFFLIFTLFFSNDNALSKLKESCAVGSLKRQSGKPILGKAFCEDGEYIQKETQYWEACVKGYWKKVPKPTTSERLISPPTCKKCVGRFLDSDDTASCDDKDCCTEDDYCFNGTCHGYRHNSPTCSCNSRNK
jgi:hypothetical protein